MQVLFSTVDNRGNVTAYGTDGIADAIHNEETCRQADATRYATDFLDNLYQDIIDAACETTQIKDVPKLNSTFNLPDGTKGKLKTISSTYTKGVYSFGIKVGKTVTNYHLPIKKVMYCAMTKEYIVL